MIACNPRLPIPFEFKLISVIGYCLPLSEPRKSKSTSHPVSPSSLCPRMSLVTFRRARISEITSKAPIPQLGQDLVLVPRLLTCLPPRKDPHPSSRCDLGPTAELWQQTYALQLSDCKRQRNLKPFKGTCC